MKKSNTAERLRFIMNERGLKQVDILRLCEPYCEKYGVKLQKNDLSQYLSGKVEPRQDKLTILGSALGVQEAWLMGYDVPRENAPVSIEDYDPDFVERAVEYYKGYDELPPDKKAALDNYLSFLLSES